MLLWYCGGGRGGGRDMTAGELRHLSVGDRVRRADPGGRVSEGVVVEKRHGVAYVTWDGGGRTRLNWRAKRDRRFAEETLTLLRGG